MAHPRSGRAIHSPSPIEERDLSRGRKRRDPNRAGKSPPRVRLDAESDGSFSSFSYDRTLVGYLLVEQ